MADVCTVRIDNVTYYSGTYIAALAQDNGDVSLFYDADTLTIGMAMRLLARAFLRAMEDVEDEEREQVAEILGDPKICDYVAKMLLVTDVGIARRMREDG